MIWATAKSTDVNSRHRAWPARANGFVGAAEAARTATGVAMIGLLDGDGRVRGRRGGRVGGRGPRGDGPGGGEADGQVLLQVLEVLEADRHAEQARRDPGSGQLGFGHLALGRRWRMDD